MVVTFTKLDVKHYAIHAVCDNGERFLGPGPRGEAPGNDEYMPHDLAHYVVEEEFRLKLGAFGQLAAGSAGIFRPEVTTRKAKLRRRGNLVAHAGRGDLASSERILAACVAEWERRIGRRKVLPDHVDVSSIAPADLERAVARLDHVSRDWRALGPGESLRFTWPSALTVQPGRVALGRRREPRASSIYVRGA